jgi:hypothetical protein
MANTLVQIGNHEINFHNERKLDPFMVAIPMKKCTVNIKAFKRLSRAIEYVAKLISSTEEDSPDNWR